MKRHKGPVCWGSRPAFCYAPNFPAENLPHVSNLDAVAVPVSSEAMLGEARDSGTHKPRRWLKRVGSAVLLFVAAMGAGDAYVFPHFVPPRLVRVVDAFTGKPIAHMNVCVQAITTGLGPKQALSSDLTTTDTNGRAFFWPSIINVGLLRSWDGYSMQVTARRATSARPADPRSGLE